MSLVRGGLMRTIFEKFVRAVNGDEKTLQILSDPQYAGRSSTIRVIDGTTVLFEGSFQLLKGQIRISEKPIKNTRTRIYMSDQLFHDMLEGLDPQSMLFQEEFYAAGDDVVTDVVLWSKMFAPHAYLFNHVRRR